MLCNRHFKATSFSDWPDSTKKLHKYAVPEVQTVSSSEYQSSSSCRETAILGDTTNFAPARAPIGHKLNEKKQTISLNEGQPAGNLKFSQPILFLLWQLKEVKF